MKQAIFASLVSSVLLVSGAVVFSSSSDALECDDLVEGDRIETGIDGADRELEIRIEADTRVRIEVKVDVRAAELASTSLQAPDHGGDDDERGNESAADLRREARVELCGFVFFEDTNGNGALDESDSVVQTSVSTFGPIEHSREDGVHVFDATSQDRTLSVTARVPSTIPAEGDSLIRWSVSASPTCAMGASHFAVNLEERSGQRLDTFLVAACGASLSAGGEA